MKNNTVWKITEDTPTMIDNNEFLLDIRDMAPNRHKEVEFLRGVICEILNQNSNNIDECLNMYRAQNS